ncbi:myo-inositol-1(or 4)-monophosphatase [Kaistia soli DSM 19436]|uniref:Myo-inositol-1(Or 4)-monophosphatase n=1 Tax=Kaistia soli DSM 19436 TaxID=1122133 RepID=A0A1M4W387_9HYPH|nr:3'(2'),5'-bisphosphate nucleotidase CysQ [Kaistia soli]SHE75669.1 myo-inositol-1(or 4)-monophosphatase [Kaistia soli DSM 19436]
MPEADVASLADDLVLISAAAVEAGHIALGFFGNNPRAWTKGGDSPVTEADIASDRSLHAALTSARPGYGWLSEESIDTPERLGRSRVFVVDPIDGTRGFMEGNVDWCVSVGIVEEGRPRVGVLFAPARQELYEATLGGGVRLNGTVIAASRPAEGAALHFAGPLRHMRALSGAGFSMTDRRVTPSLAYRLALVAAGRVDIATAAPDARDWDLAAADLLVHEAGGTLCDAEGEPIRYNRADPRHPALIAASPRLAAAAAGPIAGAESAAALLRRS